MEHLDNFPGREHMKAIETRRMRGQGGFTLIELLVVIAILGVLAGVVVFAVNGIQSNADESACKIDKRTLQTAVQAFRADRGVYPNADGSNLVTEGFLEEASTKWVIVVASPGAKTSTVAYNPAAGSGC